MRSKMARWLVAATLLAVTSVPALAAGHGWLGVTTQSTDEDLRRGLDLSRDGLLVNQVSDESPADRAGLRKGDVILTYNSRTVTEPEDLRQLVRDTEPGRSASLGIWRDGSRRTLQVTVGEMPGNEDGDDSFDVPTPPPTPRAPRAPLPPRESRDSDHGDMHRRVIINGKEVPEDEIDDTLKDMPTRIEGMGDLKDLKELKGMKGMGSWSGPGGSMLFAPMGMGRGRLGVRVEKLNDDLGQALGAEGDHGVLVVEVLEDTPAQKAGIRAGDVIVRVEGDEVDTPEALVKALAGHDGKVDLTVLRRGSQRNVQAELQSRSELRTYSRDSRDRGYAPRNPEPGQGNRVYRERTKVDNGDDGDLREEIRQLKQELRELRQQLEDKK